MSEPVADICETNSTSSFSTRLALTVPRFDMVWEISLISSSSIICQMREPCSSPSASITTAVRSAPVSDRMSSLTGALAARDMVTPVDAARCG